MKKNLAIALVLCFLLTLAGTALAEGKLVLYASTPEEFLNVVISEYEKATGVEVEVVSAGTGELYKRVEAEGDNPLGDVFLGGMVSSGYVPKFDLWEPYVSPLDTDLPEAFRNTTGKVTSFSMVPTAIMLNTDGQDRHARADGGLLRLGSAGQRPLGDGRRRHGRGLGFRRQAA